MPWKSFTRSSKSFACFNEAEARAPRMHCLVASFVAMIARLVIASMRPRRVRLGCALRSHDSDAFGVLDARFNEAEARAPRMPQVKPQVAVGVPTSTLQ